MSVASALLLIMGCTFLILAALGIVRMPDLYIRMSAASKALTLGVGLLALGLAIHMPDAGVITRAILLIVLFLLKAPVAAHALGRAAYLDGVPLWEATIVDEMRDRDLRTGKANGEVALAAEGQAGEDGSCTPER
ncbi:MAG TPA: monovalent cation/H(+) antiporter subunit G [Thermoanaerobaculia bacterium]|nr:monovalent cation/H(+) antiporter subunit G [Thermoanaerobaculia bacterium]